VNGHYAAIFPERLAHLIQRGIGPGVNEAGQARHFVGIEGGRIVAARFGFGLAVLTVLTPPALKGGKIHPVEPSDLGLSSAAFFIGRKGALSDLSGGNGHVQVSNIACLISTLKCSRYF
jgi:hypothetical protein